MTLGFSEFMQSLRSGFLDVFFNSISAMGEEYVYIILICIVYFAISKRMGELIALSLFFSLVLTTTIKGLFMVDRPYVRYPDKIIALRPSIGTSFPSAHTQGFSAFIFSGAFWLKKKYAYGVAGVLAVLMALSRVYLGVHWLEDVVVGLVLGVTAAYVLYRFYSNHQDDNMALIRLYGVLLIVFLPFLIIFGAEDLFKTYGLMVGFVFAMYLERKYVNFSMDVAVWKRILRAFFGILIMILIIAVLGKVFDKVAEEETLLMHILDMIRYGMFIFVGMGCYPFLFKKINL